MATISHVEISTCFSANSITPNPFIPRSTNLAPKWPVELDKDAWEEWQVQGLAADGSVAIVVIFFRHRLNAPAGFRVGIIASWAGDGKEERENVWCSYAALPHSILTSDSNGKFTGIWRGDEDAGSPPNAGFTVASDLSKATFTFDLPDKVVGTITLIASPEYEDLPACEDQAKFMPAFWWMRPIPFGRLNADLTFFALEKETPGCYFPRNLHLREDAGAFGAMERAWNSQPHKEIISQNWWIWARVGPYLVHVIWVRGREETPLISASARLFRDGHVVAAPQRATTLDSGKTDYDTLELEYMFDGGEGVRGKFDLQHVGQKIFFRSKWQTWEFAAVHKRPWYNIPTSKPEPGATGFSGFILALEGGLVGSGENFKGTGIAGGGTIA